MLFGWGLLSANTVQWLADGAEQDGLKQEPLVKLGPRIWLNNET